MTKKEYKEQKEFEERLMNELFSNPVSIDPLMGKKDIIKSIAEAAVKLYEGPKAKDDKDE